jgi:hypothetical protein
MKAATIVFAIAALMAGLKAAHEWYKASNVEIDLGYDYPCAPKPYRRMGMEIPRTPEPGVPELQRMNEIMATWEAVQESSRINKGAAKWTALSVGLSAMSSVFGAF